MSTVLALALSVHLAAARPKRFEGLQISPRTTGPGQVTYVTSDGAFVDRGSSDGVKVGDHLAVTRRGKPLGVCDVTRVSEHSAACSGTGFSAGDKLTVERKPEAPPTPLAAPPSAEELAGRLAKVEEAEVPRVDFEGAPVGSGQAAWLEIALSHTSASDFASANGPYQLQRADVAVRELKLWRGLHASVDLTALNWSRRPSGFRSPLTGTPNLFVRRVELAWNEPGGRFVGALGRTYTRHTPGLSVIDGAQVGVRSLSGELEGGGFGGLLPDPVRLTFSTRAWTAGAYAFARFYRGSGADAVWVQPELRAGWAVRDNLGGRVEAAASLHSWVGRAFDVHAMAQVGVAGGTATVDAARVDLGIRPLEAFRVIAAARYRGNAVGEVLEPSALSTGTKALHADLFAVLDASRSISFAVSTGLAYDLVSGLWMGRVGPEVQLPTLFGRGGLALGYAEELGWIRGRSAYLQAGISPHWRFKLLGRAFWANASGPDSAGLAGQELGGYVGAEIRPVSAVWLRLSGLLRARLDGSGAAANASAQVGLEL